MDGTLVQLVQYIANLNIEMQNIVERVKTLTEENNQLKTELAALRQSKADVPIQGN